MTRTTRTRMICGCVVACTQATNHECVPLIERYCSAHAHGVDLLAALVGLMGAEGGEPDRNSAVSLAAWRRAETAVRKAAGT